LTRQLAAKTNHEEVAGLLALMPLHRVRRPARTRTDGSLVRHRAGPQPVGHPPDRRGRRRAPGALARDRLGEFQALLTLLPGRTASVAVQEADIPCTSPHECYEIGALDADDPLCRVVGWLHVWSAAR
ncbi:MAG TPA: hypothetical protein VK499_12975, partial [Propionibacteriaceae bacterium]|nr:hypothetical protein [Propionibacteriaceae bacterium]